VSWPGASLPFAKLHGLGNDFVILQQCDLAAPMDAATARALADRHTGIGCDQLLLLQANEAAADGSWQVRIFNADGSSAQQCINGMRAVALWLQRQGLLQTVTSLHLPTVTVQIGSERPGQFFVELPMPELCGVLRPCRHADQVFVRACAVSVGNPHLIVYSDQPQQHQQRLGQAMAAAGAAWQKHPGLTAAFRSLAADGCNIGFMRIAEQPEQRVSLAVWERGSGPTRACGSAACAAAAVLLQAQDFSRIEVEQAGGALILEHRQAGCLRVTGSATHVFSGLLDRHSLHTTRESAVNQR